MRKYVSDIEARKLQERRAAGQQARSDRVQPLQVVPIDGYSGNPLRFVAIVRMPWLNKESQQLEWGFHCVGYEKLSRPPLHYRRQFTTASFRQHLEQCGEIQNQKHARADFYT
jgi:hypothetical protein